MNSKSQMIDSLEKGIEILKKSESCHIFCVVKGDNREILYSTMGHQVNIDDINFVAMVVRGILSKMDKSVFEHFRGNNISDLLMKVDTSCVN